MTPHELAMRCMVALVVSLSGLATPAGAQQASFTAISDVVPGRCFSAALTTVGADGVGADAVDIGLESGFDPATMSYRGCIASTASFHSRATADLFTVTVSAPAGMRITRISYEQAGRRFLQRSAYWEAGGIGILAINDGAPTIFGFTSPALVKSVDLSAQNVTRANVSIIALVWARRSAAFPRVSAPPGSATIEITDAAIRVEYE